VHAFGALYLYTIDGCDRRGQFSSLGDVTLIPCEIGSRAVISSDRSVGEYYAILKQGSETLYAQKQVLVLNSCVFYLCVVHIFLKQATLRDFKI
jgi:hypothetical protein